MFYILVDNQLNSALWPMCFRLYFAASTQKPPELAKYNILYSANSRIFYENWQDIIKNHLPRKNFLSHWKSLLHLQRCFRKPCVGLGGAMNIFVRRLWRYVFGALELRKSHNKCTVGNVAAIDDRGRVVSVRDVYSCALILYYNGVGVRCPVQLYG